MEDHAPPANLREPQLSRAALRLGGSRLRDLMNVASRPGILSFAVGLPATDLFPQEALAQSVAGVVLGSPAALQYSLPVRELKELIVEIMAWRGVQCLPEQVFLTSGCQQALDLLADLLLDPGGQVMFEEAIYDGIRLAVRRFEPQILTVPTDAVHGIDVEAVAADLATGARPAFLYLIPEGHNPLGVSMAQESRQRLVELARAYRVPLIEDDAYGLLGCPSAAPPALRALDENWVYYVGSFSKILAPALRVGWAVVPELLIPHLSILKHAADLDTASIGHRVVAAYLRSGRLPDHLETLRNEYRCRLSVMLAALEAHMPAGVRWNRPNGGFYLWVELPPFLDAMDLLRIAVEAEQVAFTPGEAFAAGDGTHLRHCLRLSFGNCSVEQIEEGIRRLARSLELLTGLVSSS